MHADRRGRRGGLPPLGRRRAAGPAAAQRRTARHARRVRRARARSRSSGPTGRFLALVEDAGGQGQEPRRLRAEGRGPWPGTAPGRTSCAVERRTARPSLPAAPRSARRRCPVPPDGPSGRFTRSGEALGVNRGVRRGRVRRAICPADHRRLPSSGRDGAVAGGPDGGSGGTPARTGTGPDLRSGRPAARHRLRRRPPTARWSPATRPSTACARLVLHAPGRPQPAPASERRRPSPPLPGARARPRAHRRARALGCAAARRRRGGRAPRPARTCGSPPHGWREARVARARPR